MKRKFLLALLTASCAGMATNAAALDAVGQRYAHQLTSGGPFSVKEAAESMNNTGYKDPAVLDIAAEVLLQGYKSAGDRSSTDAMAWLCRALGTSGNGRYKAAVDEAAKSGNRSIDKWCGKASDQLKASGDSYVAGSVKLSKYREGGGGGSAAAESSPKRSESSHGGKGSFKDIVVGMKEDEVEALIGPPTNMTSHVTGRAWQPFNYGGKDAVRQYALYKGKGRIIYSKDRGRYTFSVIEVVEDPAENGYP